MRYVYNMSAVRLPNPSAMKKILLLFTLLVCVCAATAQTQMVRLTRFEGKPITGISVSSAFDVELIRSDKTYAVVEINAALEDALQFELNDGVVTIGLRNTGRRWGEGNKYRARVYLSELTSLRGSGAVDIHCSGEFESRASEIHLSGAADMDNLVLVCSGDVRLECTGASDMKNCRISCLNMNATQGGASDVHIAGFNGNLACDLSGSSEMKIAGTGSIVGVKASGASSFKGEGLSSRDATAVATSASNVDLGPVEAKLEAVGSSASNITYRGDPASTSIVSSSASSVKKAI